MDEMGQTQGVRKRKTRSKGDDHVGATNVLKLLEKQGTRCAMTGRELTPEIVSVDHIVPISRGGKHVIGNIQIIHVDVNRAKATMLPDEFVELCREVVAIADQKAGQREVAVE